MSDSNLDVDCCYIENSIVFNRFRTRSVVSSTLSTAAGASDVDTRQVLHSPSVYHSKAFNCKEPEPESRKAGRLAQGCPRVGPRVPRGQLGAGKTGKPSKEVFLNLETLFFIGNYFFLK